MLKQLKSLFQLGDPLVELAKSGDAPLFARSFLESELFVVSTPVDRSLSPSAFSAEELQELMEAAARVASDGSGFRPFTYGPEGETALPIFSTEEAAADFVKTYVEAVNRVIPFVIAAVSGSVLAPLLAGHGLSVVLNALSDAELELPRDLVSEIDRAAAQASAG